MEEIHCLHCQLRLELPDYIQVDDYDGQVLCSHCYALLEIKFRYGKVQRYRIIEKPEGIEAFISKLD